MSNYDYYAALMTGTYIICTCYLRRIIIKTLAMDTVHSSL